MLSLLSRITFLLAVTAASAAAQLQDVQISASRMKLDEQTSKGGAVSTTVKQVAYKISVTNKTFKDMADVEIKYMIFYEELQHGSKDKPEIKSAKGKKAVALLESHKSVDIESEPFELTSTSLSAGYYYTSGASNRSKDAVIGVWVRVFAGGKQVGEYVNPSTLSRKNNWKE